MNTSNQLEIVTKPRIQFNLSAADYRKADGVSKSELDDFRRKCPAWYRAKQLGQVEREETPAMQFGTMLHAMVLDGSVSGFYVKPDDMTFTTKAGKEWREAHLDKPILKQSEADELHRSAAALLKHPHVAPLFGHGASEVSLFGFHAESGLAIKGRADWLAPKHLVDIKTTADASNKELSKSIYKFGYHRQAWLYLELCRQNNLPVEAFYLVAIERGDVPLINVRAISPEAIELGGIEIQAALRELKQCRESGIWPDYSGVTASPGEINLPPWAFSDTTGMELIGAIEVEAEAGNDLLAGA